MNSQSCKQSAGSRTRKKYPRFPATFLSLFLIVPLAHAQTNVTGASIGDAAPVDGVGDDLYIPLLVAGEVDGTWGPVRGLYRAELLIQVPPLPPATILSSAPLSLYLEYNPGTLGPLNVYYNPTRNSVSLNTTDYSDPGYTLVGTLVTSNSPSGYYYSIDVTPQIENAYENSSPVADFRLQVDGLNFTGAPSHYYQFYCEPGNPLSPPAYPISLDRVILIPISLPPAFGLSRPAPFAAILHWPTNAANDTLECTDSLSAPAWTPMTNEVAVVGDQFAFTVYLNKAAQFFRLRQK